MVPPLERYIRTYFPSIVLCGILLVVVIELYVPSRLEIEWTTITLIVLLLLAPYIRDLKALEVANVGSVTLQDDIESARQTVHRIGNGNARVQTRPTNGPDGEQTVPSPADGNGKTSETGERTRPAVQQESTSRDRADSSDGTGTIGFDDELHELYETEYQLLDRNPRVAVAKLRMELDVTIRSLLEEAVPERTGSGCLDPTEVVDVLHENGVVDDAFVAAYAEVRSLCNQGIHDEGIRPQDAIEIIDLGLALLRIIRSTRGIYSDN